MVLGPSRRPRPKVASANAAEATVAKNSEQFGLTPASRGRVKLPEAALDHEF